MKSVFLEMAPLRRFYCKSVNSRYLFSSKILEQTIFFPQICWNFGNPDFGVGGNTVLRSLSNK